MKSPMVKIMKCFVKNYKLKEDSGATQKALKDIATQKEKKDELMAKSIKKAKKIVVECGAAEIVWNTLWPANCL